MLSQKIVPLNNKVEVYENLGLIDVTETILDNKLALLDRNIQMITDSSERD